MKRLAQSAFAVVFGAFLVMASVIGGVMMTNPNVDSVEDASDQIVQRGEGQVLIAAGTAVAIAALGKAVYDHHKSDVDTEKLQQTDALETKKEIYDQASVQKQNNHLLDTAYSNYLNDTQTIALMEGKSAYIRALENGSAESVAHNRAIDAVADYYSVKQRNLIAAWNTSLTVANSSWQTAKNTTGVNSDYVFVGPGSSATYDDVRVSPDHFNATTSVTLTNSSTHTVPGVKFSKASYDGTMFMLSGKQSLDVFTYWAMGVRAPDSNYDRVRFLDSTKYVDRWNQIESQNTDAQNQLDTFINNTYASYQQGDINASDLVDPYLGARDYSPENSSQFQDWSLRTLSALGLNSPENLSNIGRMTVLTGSASYDGILMSDGTPSGGFTVGQTYNASNLEGLQFVALVDGGSKELSGEFTLEAAETADGTTIQENESVTYNNITYETANTSEFQALQDELDGLTAEINARQQKLRNSGGGGWLPDNWGNLGFAGGFSLVALAAGAIVLVGLNRV